MSILDQIRSQLDQIATGTPAPINHDPMLDLGGEIVAAKRQHTRIHHGDFTPIPDGVGLAEARIKLRRALEQYHDLDTPDHRLLCLVPPGVGKSHALVQIAIRAHLRGERVAYVMPRHDFLIDLMHITVGLGYSPSIWYHWQPRKAASDHHESNCGHVPAITQWLKKGHEAIKFCQGVCGYQFIKDGCLYHAQRNEALAPMASGLYPIVAIQHGHITTGHSMLGEFDLIIGDESPLGMYPHLWHIPNNEIVPRDLDHSDSAYSILATIAGISVTMADDIVLSGAALIDHLGGPKAVLHAAQNTELPHLESSIRFDYEAELASYNHGTQLMFMLASEARLSIGGESSFIERVIVRRDGLRLLLKHQTNHMLPPKVVWADATGDPALYQQITDWRIESFYTNVILDGPIHQITDSTFSKTTMLQSIKKTADGPAAKPSAKCEKTLRIIRVIIERESYINPLVVSYSELAPYVQDWAKFAYFHGNRGTNIYQECDAVFIVGTPMPAVEHLEIMARMVYSRRRKPFDTRWCQKPIPYVGTDLWYEAGGLWADPDLALLLNQMREQEIVQSAHRVRPILTPKPIWLFTALPIAPLPPTRLCTMAEALGITVAGIDAGTFVDAVDIASVEIERQGYCTSKDLQLMLDCTRQTAYKYLDALEEFDPDRFAPTQIRAVGRGGNKRAIQSIKESSDDQR